MSGHPPAGCASSRLSPPRCRRRSRVEDVSRTCLEHAATGVGAPAGLVVLRGHGDDAALDRVVGRLGDRARRRQTARSRRGRGADRGAASGAGRPASFDDGWMAFPLASGALAFAAAARAADLRRGSRVAAHARQPGRAGARSRRALRDRARDRGDDAAQRPPGAAADGRRRHARGPLPPGHGRGRRRRRLVRHHPARARLASASSSATSSARACRPRR